MKTLLSLILLMSLPGFADSQCDYVDHIQQEWLIEQIAKGKKNLLFTDLRGANLSGVDLTEANLYKADLRKTDLREANLTKAYLAFANLSFAKLQGADLTGADLIFADLEVANLRGATIDSKYRDKIMDSRALNTDKIIWVD